MTDNDAFEARTETGRKYFDTQEDAENWLRLRDFSAPETPTGYWCDGYFNADVRFNAKGFFVLMRGV